MIDIVLSNFRIRKTLRFVSSDIQYGIVRFHAFNNSMQSKKSAETRYN